jgi:hypothetical protein
MFSFTATQIAAMSALESTVKFSHQTNPARCTATLVDNFKKESWAAATVEGTGDDAERDALDKVLAQADIKHRPRTPAETAAMANRLEQYEKKFGVLEDEPAKEPKPKKETAKA